MSDRFDLDGYLINWGLLADGERVDPLVASDYWRKHGHTAAAAAVLAIAALCDRVEELESCTCGSGLCKRCKR